jgi:hypothetical protein
MTVSYRILLCNGTKQFVNGTNRVKMETTGILTHCI